MRETVSKKSSGVLTFRGQVAKGEAGPTKWPGIQSYESNRKKSQGSVISRKQRERKYFTNQGITHYIK